MRHHGFSADQEEKAIVESFFKLELVIKDGLSNRRQSEHVLFCFVAQKLLDFHGHYC